MALETAKDKIKLNQIVAQKQDIITVDGDVIVNDVKPDVLKVISTNGTLCIYKREVLNDKIKLEGCINTYIIYIADDENSSIRTINTSLDFSKIIDIDNCKEQMMLDETICIKGFETKVLNGRKLHVKAFLDANIKIYSDTDIDAIVNLVSEDEDIQMLNSSKDVMSLVGSNTGKIALKDTINIKDDDEFAEMMKVDFCISDIETKISYNKILIKANANVNVMYLTEDNRINEASNKIPIMGFIDMPNVTDTSECIAKTKVRNLNIRPNNKEEHSLCIEADIDLFCRVYEKKEINIIEDIYSTINNIELKKNPISTTTGQFTLKDTFDISQKITDTEILYGRVLGININPIVENSQARDNKIVYEGKINFEIITQNDSNINVTNVETPFRFDLESDRIKQNSNYETEINVISQEMKNADEIMMLEVTLEVNTMVQNNENLSFAQEINVTEVDDKNVYSMVIYFVKQGDTLWKIAKQFRSRVEDIARINGIEDENKIYPGQQLYIPKFTKTRIAI